ncbi:amino acid transporter [Nocardioides sp. Root190]|uniref:LysE/ArgO family amino acid transporter n=1 Tax=Nocardioides sp. Root190 TaxID=1736488 RepID=UPI0006FE28A3|nr:LysE/ArgO family amino acid transporter [Nocardioides sp. Root190]KRB76920.1 amino acid transporter [Nocardioides sp. Root190]
MITPALAGLLTGLTLIVAIGAQNAFVLRQGVLRSHVAPVVLVCALSDALLIVAGVGGIGALVDHASWVIEVVRWLGVAFLLWYAVASLRRAFHPESLAANGGSDSAPESRRRVVAKAVALTWLNPHVYLDTVLLLGSIAATHDVGEPGGRWWFAAGAVAASGLWFSGLGFGARLLAPLLARPRAWQVLEVLIAATMVFVAARLAFS